MHPSRRALVASLAALPMVATTAATTAAARADPIVAAIERHRAAFAALETVDELASPARYAAAEQEVFASGEAMFATEPQTVAGCKALVNFMVEDDPDGVEGGRCLDTLRRGLDRLAA